jgi:hypothetical protein
MALVRIIGVLASLVLVGAIIMGVVGAMEFKPRTLPGDQTGGFSGPVMALEFVETTEQAHAILDPNNREPMRRQIYLDFAWILFYALLYVTISALLARRNCPWASYLAAVAAIAGVGAAAFDVVENLIMLRVVNDPAISQSTLAGLHIRDTAIVKWTLSFVTLAILAVTFYGLDRTLTRIGFLFSLTALAGFVGLWHKPWLGLLVPLPMLLGLLLLTYAAFRSPEKFVESRC